MALSSSPPFALDGHSSPLTHTTNSHVPQMAFSAPAAHTGFGGGQGPYGDRGTGYHHNQPVYSMGYGHPPQGYHPPTALGMMGSASATPPTHLPPPNHNAMLSSSMNARNAINFQSFSQQMMQKQIMERDMQMDMYDRERQASALAAAGDVAERIGEKQRTNSLSSPTGLTQAAGGGGKGEEVEGTGEEGRERRMSGLSVQLEARGLVGEGAGEAADTQQQQQQQTTTGLPKPPSLQWNISQGDQIGTLADQLSENPPPPDNLSRNVSISSNKDRADFAGLAGTMEVGGVDDMEMDFANMFANEEFVREGGGWSPVPSPQQAAAANMPTPTKVWGGEGGEGRYFNITFDKIDDVVGTKVDEEDEDKGA